MVSIKRISLLLAGALVVLSVSVAPAGASVKAARTSISKASLKQVGFRADVAKAHGFEVATDVNGVQCVARADRKSVQTCVEMPGDCGMSYIGIENHGFPRSLNVVTGFALNGTVVGGNWGSTLVDQGGASEVNFDIGTGQNHWDGQREVRGLTPGPA
ncbi:hypothetical protein [Amycolatopsis sp. NPDC050768]|uniref:hypothetical protein n=1 Tax=Amycolatopsis sp. NPDC050768 TaxID=3154839 RepID=UPI0033F945D5